MPPVCIDGATDKTASGRPDQGVEESPSFSVLLVLSYPNSPSPRVGFELDHWE